MIELQESYREGLRVHIESLEKAREALAMGLPHAGETIRRTAHALRGSGGTYGFPEISEAASVVEAAEPAVLGDTLDRLLGTLREVAGRAGDGKTAILVIEDDAQIVSAALEGEHRDVFRAATAAEGRSILESRDIDLVILDLVLPDMDGRSLLLQMNDNPKTAGLPVFVISARVVPAVQSECYAFGAEKFFEKPINTEVLAAAAVGSIQRSGRISRDSRRDALTGLPNRAAFHEAFERATSQQSRRGAALSVAIVDLDHFKTINDRHGHATGDEVLRRFGQLLREHTRKADFCARWGGEEFVALFPDTAPDKATVALDKVRQALAGETFRGQGEEFRVTLSAGVAAVEGGGSVEESLAEADRLLYLAKASGRNRVINRRTDVGVRVREILLAEDDPDVVRVVRGVLRDEGFRVLHCADGEEALRRVAGREISLGILDVNMPGIDGFELVRRLRKDPAFARMPIVMLTGRGSEEDVIRGFDLGADDYVVKPFSPPELRARVHRLLKKA